MYSPKAYRNVSSDPPDRINASEHEGDNSAGLIARPRSSGRDRKRSKLLEGHVS